MAPRAVTDEARSRTPDERSSTTSTGTWLETAKRIVLTTPVLPITILVYVLLTVTTPGFLSLANIQNLLASMAVLALAAIGTTIVFLVAGIDLSVGSTVALSSVVGAIVIRDTGSMLLGLVVAIAVGLAIGAFNGGCIGYAGLPPFVLTLGVLLTARAVAYMAAAAAAGGGGTAASVGQLPPQVLQFGQSTFAAVPMVFWIAFLLVAAFALILSRTVTGINFYLTGANERAAGFNGIDTKRVKFLAYLIGGGLAGFAGFILTSRLGSGNATAGDTLLLEVIAATVIGGTSLFGGLGGVWRTLIGAFLITGLTNALGLQGMPYWYQQIIVGLVIVFGSALAMYLQRFQGRRR
jgi:ribose/xylose/arabinose/galactoside ABC-type transport system permease subunit